MRLASKRAFLAIFLLSLFLSQAWAQAEKTAKKILILQSYHAEYPWVQGINEGIKRGLKGREGIEVQTYYMDTKRNTSQEFKAQAGKEAREKISSWLPDVVIACDDNAQLFVTQHFLNKKPYFVFCGVNADPAVYGFPASNVTGIIERPQYKASIALLETLVPHIKRIAVIADTDPTSVGTLGFLQLDPPAGIQVLGYNIIGDFELWKKRVKEYERDADALCIYMYHTVKKEEETSSMPPKEVMEWTIANCGIPTVGMFDFAIEDGMLCGVVESAQEHGYEAAEMALALLDGKDIKSLPIKRADIGVRMLNLKTAEKLKINIPKETLEAFDRVIE